MGKPNNYELAWGAGFIDGEGCFRFTEGKGRILTLRVEQVNLENLQRLQATVGGNLLGPYSFKSRPNNKPIYTLTIGTQEIKKAIGLLWPFLGSEKKLQYIKAARAYVKSGIKRRATSRFGPKALKYHTESFSSI